MINETFNVNGTTYKVTASQAIGEELLNMRNALINNGKDAVVYYASKVLKSGQVSEKQGGMFYRFTKSGNFIKV